MSKMIWDSTAISKQKEGKETKSCKTKNSIVRLKKRTH